MSIQLQRLLRRLLSLTQAHEAGVRQPGRHVKGGVDCCCLFVRRPMVQQLLPAQLDDGALGTPCTGLQSFS
jgi:hypothetical protein